VPNTPRQREFQSAGSGVIVDAKNGYIITNAHVVENATEITVQLLDNRSLTAKVVGKDPGSDVAVLKVQANNLLDMPDRGQRQDRGWRFRRRHRQPVRPRVTP
jgi:S1-C subfamily serine protease